MNLQTASTRECEPPAARASLKRPCENSGEEPPRVKCHASITALGEDVNRVDYFGSTPLHYAAEKGDVQRVKKLIQSGADARLRNQFGETPLHCALIWNKETAAELLAEADNENDTEDEQGMTPLLYAAEKGYVETIRKLLAGGARTRFQGRWGRTPLHFALHSKIETAAELLAEADASNDIIDGDEMTPLLCAAENGYVKTITMLLAGGARVRFQGRGGKTPLHSALEWQNEAAAVVLAEVDSSNNIQDEDGMTPLHHAVEKGFQRVVKKFVQSGMNPHVKDRLGFYPIKMALMMRGNDNISKMLLSMYALRGIGIDWKELLLVINHLRFCKAEFSRCNTEIKRMKRMKVPASSITLFTLITRHVSWVAMHVWSKIVRGVLRYDFLRLGFPVYADLIEFKLRRAQERRMLMDQWLAFSSFLSPPLPTACAEIALLCLTNSDIMNFMRAFQLNS